MSFIFDFGFRLSESENWLFNFNHLFLFVGFVLIMLALYYGINTKTKEGVIVTKVLLICALVIFEFGRILWTFLERNYRGIETTFNDWIRIWSFEICAIMVWVTVITLILSIFIDKNNKYLVIFKNVIFGAATMGALLTFVVPVHIDSYRPIFHWRNFQTIVTHILLIYAPFYLVKIGELEVKIKNLWMPVMGFFFAASINIMVAHLSGINFFGALEDRHVIHILGSSIPHPLHYLVMFALAFGGTCVLYSLAQVFKKDKGNVGIKGKNEIKFMDTLPYVTGFLMIMLMLYMPMLFGVDFSSEVEHYSQRALKSWSAILIMLPFFIQVTIIYVLEYVKTKENNKYKVNENT